MLHYRGVGGSRLQKISDIALCVFGAVVMIYTTSLTIVNWVGGEESPKSPGYCDSRKMF